MERRDFTQHTRLVDDDGAVRYAGRVEDRIGRVLRSVTPDRRTADDGRGAARRCVSGFLAPTLMFGRGSTNWRSWVGFT